MPFIDWIKPPGIDYPNQVWIDNQSVAAKDLLLVQQSERIAALEAKKAKLREALRYGLATVNTKNLMEPRKVSPAEFEFVRLARAALQETE